MSMECHFPSPTNQINDTRGATSSVKANLGTFFRNASTIRVLYKKNNLGPGLVE